MELLIKRCLKCGAMVEVLHDCNCGNCGIRCCNEEMTVLKPNTFDADAGKHLPVIEKVGNYITVTVPHTMEENHYIEWIALVGEKVIGKKLFKTGDVAKAVFPYQKGTKVYSYCNKHSLWYTEVK